MYLLIRHDHFCLLKIYVDIYLRQGTKSGECPYQAGTTGKRKTTNKQVLR